MVFTVSFIIPTVPHASLLRKTDPECRDTECKSDDDADPLPATNGRKRRQPKLEPFPRCGRQQSMLTNDRDHRHFEGKFRIQGGLFLGGEAEADVRVSPSHRWAERRDHCPVGSM